MRKRNFFSIDENGAEECGFGEQYVLLVLQLPITSSRGQEHHQHWGWVWVRTVFSRKGTTSFLDLGIPGK